jgi:predicted nucleotidyltransferase
MVQNLQTALTVAFRVSPVPGVVSAYLFGSHARGEAHRESDVDLGVLLDRTIHRTRQARFDARLALTAHVARQIGTDSVDLITLEDAPPHLVRRVMTDGLRIHCTDAAVDHAARRTALLRAADLAPFLRRMRRIKLAAFER